MKSKLVTLQPSEDVVLQLPEGWGKEGEKVFIDERDGCVYVSKAVNVEIDIDDKTFMTLAKMAHGRDITLNALCNELMAEYVNKLSQNNVDKDRQVNEN